MKILSFLIISTLLLSGCQSPGPDKAVDNAAIDTIFARWDRNDSPGCALAVIQEGEMIYSQGYGVADLEHDIPITPKSVFYIGSVSKQFVTTSLLLLEEEGKISLDDDVRTYIPELPDYGHPITLRNLVHHTSGLRDNLTLWELSGRSMIDDIPEDEVFEMICRQQGLNFVPGEDYAYSNTCYFLMSIIIERVSGQRLRAFAEERVFRPLGMNNSQFNDDNQRILKNRAFGYTRLGEDSIGNLIMRFDLVGSGGLYSTVEDLYLWDQNFYNNQLGNQGQALVEQLQTNGRYNNGEEVNYAFAMINGEYRGLRTIHHTGSMGGYRAVYLRFPDQQFSVIILGNLATLRPLDRAYEVADLLLAEQMAARKEDPEPQPVATQEDEENSVDVNLQNFTGEYYSKELNVTYRLYPEQGQMMMEVPGRDMVSLEAHSELVLQNQAYRLTFDEDMNTFDLSFYDTKGIRFEKKYL